MTDAIPIGICTNPDRAEELPPGYAYWEPAVSSALIPLEDDESYEPQRQKLLSVQLPIRAFNAFVPGEVRLVGNNVQWERVEQYIERAVRRAADLGGKIIVFGSGGARAVPEAYPRKKAWQQLIQFLRLCAAEASKHDLTIVIEPLNRLETNILNSYTEAVQLAKEVDREHVQVLADIYHFMMEDEPLANIQEAPEWLAHVHLADSGRHYPGSGSYPLQELFDLLRGVGYEGRASIECRWGEDFSGEATEALRFLQSL
ncbi:MAG: sugar phosphate isomerase/epimerase family protein [Chloroflexota bacterium]|nr:sugar phosphate isomerase/epimerase family protein [Chloroflexota bacterium]